MERFKTLKDHVYDYIATQIRGGNLMPGERVNENHICEELSISRTPVREALIQLTAEGILENKSRKGFVIRNMSIQDARELYMVIGVLDGAAAKLACPHLTKQDYADMAFYIDAVDLALRAGNFEMYHKQQEIFHEIYIEKCGNSALINTIHQSKNKLLKRTYADDAEGAVKKILLSTNEEHRHILRLFQEGDSAGLFTYLSETHWAPTYATFDVVK